MSDDRFSAFNLINFLKLLGKSSSGHNISSLFKELIDNAVDAHAKHIMLRLVKNNGYFIEITDDGYGMNKHDLYRCIQFYSTNINHNIGKFGIGGSTALVFLSDFETKTKTKYLSIKSKSRDGNVVSVSIDWNMCSTISTFEENVEKYFKHNDATVVSETVDLDHGTIFNIQTSEKLFNMIRDDMQTDMSVYINFGLTYKHYINDGLCIHLFEDEPIKAIDIVDPIYSSTLTIDIFVKDKKIGYCTQIRSKRYCQMSSLKNRKLKECKVSELETFEYLCSVKLNLCCPRGIYQIEQLNLVNYKCIKKTSNFSPKNLSDMKHFCQTTCGFDINDDREDIEYLSCQFLKPLYVNRKTATGTRCLGKLTISNNPMDYGSEEWIKSAICCLYKNLIITPENDEKLRLIQENKSVIEWTNSPKWLREHIEYIQYIWVKQELAPQLDRLNLLYLEPYNKAASIIQDAYRKFTLSKQIQKETIACIKIQHWFRSLKTFNMSLRFRKFMIWCIKRHNAAAIIQRTFRNYNELKTIKPNQQHQRELSAITIQKCFRGYITRKHIDYELAQHKRFCKEIVHTSSDFIKTITTIKTINDMYTFSKQMNDYFVSMKSKYKQTNVIFK